LFIFHSMLYFYIHHEIPAVLRGEIGAHRMRYYVDAGGIGADWWDAAAGRGNGGDSQRRGNDNNVNVHGADDNGDTTAAQLQERRTNDTGRYSEEQIGMSLSGPNSRAPSPSFNLYQGTPPVDFYEGQRAAAAAAVAQPEVIVPRGYCDDGGGGGRSVSLAEALGGIS
jgi:hypothetical protein